MEKEQQNKKEKVATENIHDDDDDVEPLDPLFHVQRLRFELVHTAPAELVSDARRQHLLQQIQDTIRTNSMYIVALLTRSQRRCLLCVMCTCPN